MFNRPVGVVDVNILLHVRHEDVKVHAAVLGLGLDVGAGRHHAVTAVDVGDPVTDLFALIEGLADNPLVVVLPGRSGTARLVGPGRLGGDVLGVGLGGVEAPNPADQGIAEQVTAVIGSPRVSSRLPRSRWRPGSGTGGSSCSARHPRARLGPDCPPG